MENIKYEYELFQQISHNSNRTELKHSLEQISSLQELIESEDFYEILRFIIEQKINVVELIGYDYTNFETLFNLIDSGFIEKEDILEDKFYQCCEKAFEEIGYSAILEYVEKVRKSPTRSKGQEFRNFMKDNHKEFEENTRLKTIFDYCDLPNAFENGVDFIYIPDKDSKSLVFLESIDVNLGEKKGKDFLAKIDNTFYLGEVKNISTGGGAQNHQLNDMIITSELNESVNGYNVQGLGVLYGKVLFSKNKYSNEIESNENVISLGSFFSCQWGF